MTVTVALTQLIAQGESETLELKRSTAELKRAGETLCAFLNGEGGKVLIGVAPTAGSLARRSPTSRSATSRRCSTASNRPHTSTIPHAL